jgi:hypothetical protein
LVEPDVSEQSQSDFASLLDDLISAARERERSESVSTPTLRHDLLEQLDRLQKDANFPQARKNGEAFEAYAEASQPAPAPPSDEPTLEPVIDDLFYLDPGVIARELGIRKARTGDELDRARRSFAKQYHPDRVPEEMRERAKMRMQIANMLIDQAKRRVR